MQAYLVVVAGPDKGKRYLLAEGQALLVGRGPSSATQLADPHASRRHCLVCCEGDRVTVADQGSTAGTFVNHQRVERHVLTPGDVLRVGTTELVLEVPAAAALPAQAAAAQAAGVRAAGKARPLKELGGEMIAHFQVQRPLASGTTGMVFLAHDARQDMPVALKVLWPEFAGDEENMQRFVRAMQTMLPLRHPNIVALHAAGKTGPYCWAAMEFVEGENLADVIRRISREGLLDMEGQLDWSDALRAGVHVARALEAAFDRQVIHRNITPRNILLRASDRVAKLGDLMLAKALEGSLARQVTRPGQLLGDLAYMAPERTHVQAEVDCRSDIYGLGATMYALLAGRPPFEADSLPELIRQVRSAPPPPPRQFQLGVPALLQDVVLKCLAKEPGDRYQTPKSLLHELLRVSKAEGIDV